jgi:hypothetical protein
MVKPQRPQPLHSAFRNSLLKLPPAHHLVPSLVVHTHTAIAQLLCFIKFRYNLFGTYLSSNLSLFVPGILAQMAWEGLIRVI